MIFFNGPYKNPIRNFWGFLRHDLPQGIRNLVIYAPIIWYTREWDQVFLYELMEFKLKRMEKILRHGVTTDRKKIADQIKITHRALYRLIKDDYWKDVRIKYCLNNKRQSKDLQIVAKGMKQSLRWWD